MSLIDEARTVAAEFKITNAKKARREHPTGWEPGVDTERGKAVARFDAPLKADGYEDAFTKLLESWGFDSEQFMIDSDTVEVRTWEGMSNVKGPYGGEIVKFWYYKAKVVRRRSKEDIEELLKRIRSRKPLKSKKVTGGDRAFVVINSDWQLGKKDGEGTTATVEAVLNAIPAIRNRYQALRTQGRKLETLVIANLGDLIEGCAGFYPMQTFSVELSRREQVRLGRELLTSQIMAWADDFDKVIVLTVGGNHGENRNDDGKSFTNLGDNDDVAMVEQVAESFRLASASSSRYENVKFLIPDNELAFTLNLHETIVGFTHGHTAGRRRGTGRDLPHTKVWDWWAGQMMGRQPVTDADILLSGHFHYLSVITQGGRTAIQVPALDDGSGWFEDISGMGSMAAIVTMVIGGGMKDGKVPGWSDLYLTTDS